MRVGSEFCETVDLPADGVSLHDARIAIDALRGRRFVNRATGISAQLSSSAEGKLVSNKATGKSKANGFSREQHNAMAARIDALFAAAVLKVSRPDKTGDVNILSIKRFATKVSFGELSAVAWITVKESRQHGHHIYSVEAIKLEALNRIVEVACANTPHALSASLAHTLPNNCGTRQGGVAVSGQGDKGIVWVSRGTRVVE